MPKYDDELFESGSRNISALCLLLPMMLSHRCTIQESIFVWPCVTSGTCMPPASPLSGYNNPENGRILKKLFDRPYFKIKLLPDAVSATAASGTGEGSSSTLHGLCAGWMLY